MPCQVVATAALQLHVPVQLWLLQSLTAGRGLLFCALWVAFRFALLA
jgi:hypothetical protein